MLRSLALTLVVTLVTSQLSSAMVSSHHGATAGRDLVEGAKSGFLLRGDVFVILDRNAHREARLDLSQPVVAGPPRVRPVSSSGLRKCRRNSAEKQCNDELLVFKYIV